MVFIRTCCQQYDEKVWFEKVVKLPLKIAHCLHNCPPNICSACHWWSVSVYVYKNWMCIWVFGYSFSNVIVWNEKNLITFENGSDVCVSCWHMTSLIKKAEINFLRLPGHIDLKWTLLVSKCNLTCACHPLLITGRGLKSGDNFKLLYDLADKLNAAGTVLLSDQLLSLCFPSTLIDEEVQKDITTLFKIRLFSWLSW